MLLNGLKSRAQRLLFGSRRSDVRAEAGFADPVEAEVLAGLVEADGVGAALVFGVAELDAVVSPEADIADV